MADPAANRWRFSSEADVADGAKGRGYGENIQEKAVTCPVSHAMSKSYDAKSVLSRNVGH